MNILKRIRRAWTHQNLADEQKELGRKVAETTQKVDELAQRLASNTKK